MKILAEQIHNLTGVLDPTSVEHWDSAYDHSLITGDTSIHHEHVNKLLLDAYTQSDGDIAYAVLNAHLHANKSILDEYTATNTEILSAISSSHSHTNKILLDTYDQTNVDIALAIANQHLHLNKTLLDSLTGFTNEDLLGVITDRHTHINKLLLDTYTFSNEDVLDTILNSHIHANLLLLDTYTQTDSDISNAILNTHIHENKALLDTLVNNGLGNLFLADDGVYREVSVTLEAAGSDTQLMFNDGGVLSGDPDMTFNKANNLLTVNSLLSLSNIYVADTSTHLSKDGSNNLVFTDAVSGSITLSTLLSGAVNPWTVSPTYINYGTAGTNRVGINTTTTPASALEVVGSITATDFDSSLFRYKSSNLLIGPNAGDNETGSSKLYIDINTTSTPLIYGDFVNRVLRFHGDVYIEGTRILNFGSATSRIFRGSGDQLSFQDAVANSGNPILLTELIDGTYNVLASDFTDLTAVQSITTGNKTTWNKASYLITTGSGDSFLSDDGTYKAVSGGSGGSSTTLYLHNETSDVSGYEKLLNSPANAVEDTDVKAVTLGTSPVLLDDYVTDPAYPGITVIPSGLWTFKTWLSVDNATGTTSVTIRVYKRNSGGTETELFNVNTGEVNSTVPLQYLIETVQPEYTIDATDRIVIKYYASTSTASSINVSLYYEGTAHYSYIITPISFASTAINDYTWKWDATYSYIRPYADKTEAGGVLSSGKFYAGSVYPTATNRLNYDGYLYTTNLNTGTASIKETLFDTTSYEPAHAEGRVYWSSDYHTLNLMPDISGNILQIGQEVWVRCINQTGSIINNGAVVKVIGAVGDKISVALASADTYTNAMSTIGLATSTITNGNEGYITILGDVHGLNTSSFSAGQLLYLSPTTPGGLTTTRPVAPNQVVSIGIVNRSNASTGVIGVQIRVFPTIDRLSDVFIDSIENKQVLGWDASQNRWENVDKREVQYTGLTYNPANPILFDNDYQYAPYTLTTNITPAYSTTNALPLSYVQMTFIGNGSATVNFTNFVEATLSGTFDISNGAENKVAFYYDGTDYVYCILSPALHNNLSGLQGGSSTERYHLTSAQYTVATQSSSSTLNGYLSSTDWSTFNNKQSLLVSGTNIKTVNGTSILGSGNLTTVSPVSNVFKWDSANSYYTPYTSKTEAGGSSSGGKFYLGTSNPTSATRLNYDGLLVSNAINLYPSSSTVYGIDISVAGGLTGARIQDTNGTLTISATDGLFDYTVSPSMLRTIYFRPAVANTSAAVAYYLSSGNDLTIDGAKLLSIANSGSEKAFIDKDGNIDIKGEFRINGVPLGGSGTTPTDNFLDWYSTYYRPYTSQQSFLSFDTGVVDPTLTTRINLNGYLYASRLYSEGLRVYGGTASSSTTGALSSTDWTTFNNKKPKQSVGLTYNPANALVFDKDYQYNAYTLTTNITPTYSLTGAVALNSVYLTIVGDGTHTIDFINFTKGAGSGDFDVTLGAENRIHFYYDGSTVYYSIMAILVHNELDLIQGGIPGEKYHMSMSEYNAATREANSSQSGLLTSTDWSTFNSKENALGNPSVNGYVLSSTTSGTRSWVAASGGGITPTDNILDWNSTNNWYAPYSSKQASMSFYTGTTNPTLTTRLNLDGRLYTSGGYFAGDTTTNPVMTISATSGSIYAALYAENYSGNAISAFASNTAITGQSTSGVGVIGISSSNDGVFGSSNTGSAIRGVSSNARAGYFLQDANLSNAYSNPTIEIVRQGNRGTATIATDVISILDNPTTSGTLGGKILSATVGTVERISLNPRVANGSSTPAYLLDTHVVLNNAASKILSIRNNGTEKVYVGTGLLNNETLGVNATNSNGVGILATSAGRGVQAVCSGSSETIYGYNSSSGVALCGYSNTGIGLWLETGTSNTSKSITIRNNSIERAYVNSTGKYHFTTGTSSTFAVSGGTLKDFYTDVSTSGTSDTVLYTYTIPGNTLANNGDKLVVEFAAVFPNVTNTDNRVNLYFNGDIVENAYAHGQGSAIVIKATLIRVNATTVKTSSFKVYEFVGTLGEYEGAQSRINTITATLSSNIVLEFSGRCPTAGTITAKLGTIEYKPAAIN